MSSLSLELLKPESLHMCLCAKQTDITQDRSTASCVQDKVHPTHRFVELLVPHVLQAVQPLLQ